MELADKDMDGQGLSLKQSWNIQETESSVAEIYVKDGCVEEYKIDRVWLAR